MFPDDVRVSRARKTFNRVNHYSILMSLMNNNIISFPHLRIIV